MLPKPYLNRITGINLDDKKQWKDIIHPTLNYNKAVIDSYLSSVVFPMEAKEFPHKLSTSGWDVAALKTHPTTGFSGTNDNQYLLPLSMKQLDTPEQLNTNARVLSFLLRKENSYMYTAGPNDERLGVEQLLRILADNPGKREIKVLLDVGAQVLELRNHEVAKRWLELVPDYTALAAVYFNENDELTVLTKDGNTEPLMVSAYADRLDNCLVYLDEAHTRGTDLKLPRKGRAAVTLGPNLTKDRLVQGTNYSSFRYFIWLTIDSVHEDAESWERALRPILCAARNPPENIYHRSERQSRCHRGSRRPDLVHGGELSQCPEASSNLGQAGN